MNVLFVDQFSELGGGQRCLLDLLPAVAERGWNASAVLPSGGPLNDLFRKRGIRVENIRAGGYGCGKKSIGDIFQFAADVPQQAAVIARLLRESPADLAYVNGPRLLAATALAVRGRIPILFHAHHYVGQPIAVNLEGFVLHQSRATVAACCDAVRRALEKWVLPERMNTIPNGTDDIGFHERVFDHRAEIRIGIIGRIAPEKGQAEFLRAAALLAARTPRLRFVICGAPLFGDDRYNREVIQLAANLPVEFLDWQDDIAAVMRDLDILVIASKQEGMPRVILEAFSAGLPVIAFPVGGIPEVMDDGFTGFLTQASSPKGLAAKLLEVLEMNPVRLRNVARNARKLWERYYTLAAYRERITNLMERCAARETVSRPSRRSAMRPPVPEDTQGG